MFCLNRSTKGYKLLCFIVFFQWGKARLDPETNGQDEKVGSKLYRILVGFTTLRKLNNMIDDFLASKLCRLSRISYKWTRSVDYSLGS